MGRFYLWRSHVVRERRGGEGEIRTLGTLRFTRFPSVHSRPHPDTNTWCWMDCKNYTQILLRLIKFGCSRFEIENKTVSLC